MMQKIKLYSGQTFELNNENSLTYEQFYTYMQHKYGVGPIQICFNGNNIWLTNKLGEKYAMIGEVI